MTKEDFKTKWESDDDGGGITFEDIANVAEEWGLYQNPRTHRMSDVLESVLEVAGCETVEEGD